MSGAGAVVTVLAGGPGSEHEVSLRSADGIAGALEQAGFAVRRLVLDAHDEGAALAAIGGLDAGGVVFPALHGPFGEGGAVQAALASRGIAFVGCDAAASALLMDKLATKLLAASIGIATPAAAVYRRGMADPPIPTPLVVKPVHEGSSVGLRICPDADAWRRAASALDAEAEGGVARATMIEAWVPGRELTIGLVEVSGGAWEALDIVEIRPRSGVYDYAAKYTSGDTAYTVGPELPSGVASAIAERALRLVSAAGARHLARADFRLDERGEPWLLEVNTLPGFTPNSLYPMSASARLGGLAGLVAHLVGLAGSTRGCPGGKMGDRPGVATPPERGG